MSEHVYRWAVVGAGPAGIAAIGKLLDSDVPPDDIIWLDPDFNVGALGTYWSNVSSNTKAKLFSDFLSAYNAFNYADHQYRFALPELDQEQTCTLSRIVEPLRFVTEQLRSKVCSLNCRVEAISSNQQHWFIQTDNQGFVANKVILATGAMPKTLAFDGLEVISLEQAIDAGKLKALFSPKKTYAVFGSSHSAIIVIKNLVELGGKLINFYRSPLRYAVDMGDWTLFDNTGLKGKTAAWAKENMYQIEQCHILSEQFSEKLGRCDEGIYAVGFEKNQSILINGQKHVEHHPNFGMLAPNLFGLGIAYPELKTYPQQYVEHNVGIWKFHQYLERVFPLWQRYL